MATRSREMAYETWEAARQELNEAKGTYLIACEEIKAIMKRLARAQEIENELYNAWMKIAKADKAA